MWKKLFCSIAITFSFVMNLAFAFELYYQYESSSYNVENAAPVIFECNGKPMEYA